MRRHAFCARVCVVVVDSMYVCARARVCARMRVCVVCERKKEGEGVWGAKRGVPACHALLSAVPDAFIGKKMTADPFSGRTTHASPAPAPAPSPTSTLPLVAAASTVTAAPAPVVLEVLVALVALVALEAPAPAPAPSSPPTLPLVAAPAPAALEALGALPCRCCATCLR